MNSLVNGNNDNGVNVSTNVAHGRASQLPTPTRMGLLNNSVKDGITRKVLLLKPSKIENGQFGHLVTLALTPTLNSNVNNGKHDGLNRSKNLNSTTTTTTTASQLAGEMPLTQGGNGSVESSISTAEVKKDLKCNPCRKDSLKTKSEIIKKCKANEVSCRSLQATLEKQTKSLIKRIKRLQAKQLQKHSDKQLKGLVKYEQSASCVGCQYLNESKREERSNCSGCPSYQKKQVSSSAEDKIKLFPTEGVKSLSTSALVNLVKRLENSAIESNTYQSCVASPSSSTQTSLQQQCQETSTDSPEATKLSKNLKEEADTVNFSLQKKNSSSCEDSVNIDSNSLSKNDKAEQTIAANGTLRNALEHLEVTYDSDATESSSGGESCDELSDYYLHKQPLLPSSNVTIPIDKRASWKWCVERGAIGSRWTWLQAQVADLEFKIRQQNEMYRQLRANKGTITFYCRENPSPTSTNVPQTSSHKQCSTSEGVDRTSASAPSDDEVLHCVRTLPLKQMRKRKLVRSVNALAGATRKVARHSTVQCICNSLPHFVSPCVLCNGRFGYVQVIDTDCMPQYERVALLDSSCHSVLSLPNDVSLGLYFSKLLKKETVQQPVTTRHQYKKRKVTQGADFSFKFGVDGRKGRKSQAVISSSKLRKKYEGTVKRKYSKNSCGDQSFGKRTKFRDAHEHSNGSGDAKYDPLSSSLYSEMGTSAPLGRRRRSEQHAYDINNIVIPYSIASATRVEKLQYKEILTPKWRITEDATARNDSDSATSETEETENLSDEVFAERHEKCEADEKKRFGSVLKTHGNTGPGRGRWPRTRLDSTRSECNANGVVGSAKSESVNNVDSSSQDSFNSNPINLSASPAATALTVSDQRNNQEVTHGAPAKTTERQRTSSSSKRDGSIDEECYIEVQPFEKRDFPLSDVDYEDLLKVRMAEDNEVEEPKKESEIIEKPPEEEEEAAAAGAAEEVKNPENPPPPISPQTPRSTSSSSLVDNGVDSDDNVRDPEWEPKKV